MAGAVNRELWMPQLQDLEEVSNHVGILMLSLERLLLQGAMTARLDVQTSWLAQHFANLEVQMLLEVQHFVNGWRHPAQRAFWQGTIWDNH